MNLIHGECVEAMRTLPAESVDLTVTSPPYDNLRTYNGSAPAWNESVWQAAISEIYRLTRPGGVAVWIVSDATVNGSETGSSFKQALFAMQAGFRLHDTMIWNKGGFSAVGSLRIRYAPVFEYMFVWSKGAPKTFNPIKDKPNKHAGTANHGTMRVDGDNRRPVTNSKTIADFGQRYNIWEQPPHRQKGDGKHPAPFPQPLARDHVVSWSNPGDTVLDPFMGSGTTGAACAEECRLFIGIEADADYIAIARARLGEATEWLS